MAFLKATLAMIEDREGQPASAYQPALLGVWRVPEAIVRVTSLLAQEPQGLSLVECLPPIPAGTMRRKLQQRAALATTLVASLELARDASLTMTQGAPFGPILLRPRPDPAIVLGSAA